MQFSGTYDFSEDRLRVWAALNDPAVLRETIPGCETLERIGEGEYTAHIKLRFGLLRFSTTGQLRVEVQEDAREYRLYGQSGQTLFGAGGGVSHVILSDLEEGGTHLRYIVHATLEGRLAKLGAGLVSGQMQSLGTRFFERFQAAMQATSS